MRLHSRGAASHAKYLAFSGWTRGESVADCRDHTKCRLVKRSSPNRRIVKTGGESYPCRRRRHRNRHKSSRASARSCARPAAISSNSSISSCSASTRTISRERSFPPRTRPLPCSTRIGVFWLGALMRPVGAIVLGAYIDRIGRRQGLIVTLALMALGTVVIAFCPSYAIDRHRLDDHCRGRPTDTGVLRRRRTGRRLGLSFRNSDAGQSRLLHLVPVRPASRSRSSSRRSSALS